MQILPLNNLYISANRQKALKIGFKSAETVNINRQEKPDTFKFSNIDSITLTPAKNLKNILYKKPIHVSEALQSIIDSDNDYIRKKIYRSVHSKEEIKEIKDALNEIKDLDNYKVKKLLGIGAFAFVFETEDGDVLKVMACNHFPDNRKPAFFDLPIKKHGANKGVHYYIEEKVFQDNLKQEELKHFIKTIEDAGYKLSDHLEYHDIDVDGEYLCFIAARQFGKTKNGRLYLIDPGCAKEPEKPSFAQILKRKLCNIIFENYP